MSNTAPVTYAATTQTQPSIPAQRTDAGNSIDPALLSAGQRAAEAARIELSDQARPPAALCIQSSLAQTDSVSQLLQRFASSSALHPVNLPASHAPRDADAPDFDLLNPVLREAAAPAEDPAALGARLESIARSADGLGENAQAVAAVHWAVRIQAAASDFRSPAVQSIVANDLFAAALQLTAAQTLDSLKAAQAACDSAVARARRLVSDNTPEARRLEEIAGQIQALAQAKTPGTTLLNRIGVRADGALELGTVDLGFKVDETGRVRSDARKTLARFGVAAPNRRAVLSELTHLEEAVGRTEHALARLDMPEACGALWEATRLNSAAGALLHDALKTNALPAAARELAAALGAPLANDPS